MKKLWGLLLVTALLGGCGSSTSGPTESFRVPSPAMVPSVNVGNHVIVSLNSNYVPAVGDIVVFHPPAGADPATPVCGNAQQEVGHPAACSTPTSQESAQTFIKRVVAGPGDTFEMFDGHAVRNGQPEAEPYIAQCGSDPSCNFRTPIKIPAGDFFVLGDNRGASDDSRFWGPVPKAWIIGKVVKIER